MQLLTCHIANTLTSTTCFRTLERKDTYQVYLSELSQYTLLQGSAIHLAHTTRWLHSSCSGGLGGEHSSCSGGLEGEHRLSFTILLHCTTRVRVPR